MIFAFSVSCFSVTSWEHLEELDSLYLYLDFGINDVATM
jgi:hypothetical protein